MSATDFAGERSLRVPIVDDGDELRFCSTCAFGAVCLADGYDKAALKDLHCLVEHVGPFRNGEYVFRSRDRFDAIYAVRGGAVKTCLVDEEGREQVLGFHLPGEMIGLNAIHPAHYPCDAIALDSTWLCRFSFPALAMLAARMPAVQQHLFRLLSADIGKASMLAGDTSASERVSAFLVNIAGRFANRGFSPTRLRLSMSRGDLGNYLRLAPETISRVLRKLQDEGFIRVAERDIELLKPVELRRLARCILHE